MAYPPPEVVEISDEDEDDTHLSSSEQSSVVTEANRGLLQALNSIESTGNIATFAHYPSFVNPGLTIEGGNLIPLPFKEDDAQAIKGI